MGCAVPQIRFPRLQEHFPRLERRVGPQDDEENSCAASLHLDVATRPG